MLFPPGIRDISSEVQLRLGVLLVDLRVWFVGVAQDIVAAAARIDLQNFDPFTTRTLVVAVKLKITLSLAFSHLHGSPQVVLDRGHIFSFKI